MTPLDLLDFWQKCIMTRKACLQNFSFFAHLLSKGLFTWTWDSELLRDNDCPGASVTSRSHDDLFSGATLPRGKFIFIWSLRIDLNSCSFHTNCYREWILNTFTYFWCCLELFIEKFILNINNEHAQDYSCPGVTFAFCSPGEKLPRQGGLPASRSHPGATKNLCEQLQAPDHAPRQSWLRGQWAAPGQWVVPGSCEQALSYIISKLYLNLAYAKYFTEKLCPLKQILFKV